MPLLNKDYWVSRFGFGSPCWSGDRWVDWEHGVVARHAIRRIFPRDASRIVDVGCGDGRFTLWMSGTFDVEYLGVDALEFPGVKRLGSAFYKGDAEELEAILSRNDAAYGRWEPDLVVFMNSLAYMSDWRKAVRAGMAVAPRVLVFDNFQTPTPVYLTDLSHRKPITVHELLAAFAAEGWELEKAVAADWFHRKLLLRAPQFLQAPVALLTCVMDLAVAHLLPVHRARHMAVLFRRRTP